MSVDDGIMREEKRRRTWAAMAVAGLYADMAPAGRKNRDGAHTPGAKDTPEERRKRRKAGRQARRSGHRSTRRYKGLKLWLGTRKGQKRARATNGRMKRARNAVEFARAVVAGEAAAALEMPASVRESRPVIAQMRAARMAKAVAEAERMEAAREQAKRVAIAAIDAARSQNASLET